VFLLFALPDRAPDSAKSLDPFGSPMADLCGRLWRLLFDFFLVVSRGRSSCYRAPIDPAFLPNSNRRPSTCSSCHSDRAGKHFHLYLRKRFRRSIPESRDRPLHDEKSSFPDLRV